MKKKQLIKIGLIQAIGVTAYTILISVVLMSFERLDFQPPGLFAPALILILLVFSAALTGALVFGYPAFLALQKKTKEAVYIFAYTLLFLLLIFVLQILLFATNLI